MNVSTPTPTKLKMKKPSLPSSTSIPLLFFLTLSILSLTNASFSRTISREQLGLKAQNNQTHLTFYYHDILSGPNPTSSQIAKATSTDQSPTSFGALVMIDNPLTTGPETTSSPVGRAQGMQASADLNISAFTMIMNFVFLQGDYNGSTLSVLGRNQVSEDVRELPVVGGTGAFRFAKGYAQAKTQSLDQKSGDSVVKYDVYVSHADSLTTGGSDEPGSTGSPSSGPKSAGSTSSYHAPALTGSFSLFAILVSLLVYYLV